MNVPKRIGRMLRRRREPLPEIAAAEASTPLRHAINDAEAYGVTTEQAEVIPGRWYWQAWRIHHLSPDENNGRHELHVDLLDSQTATPQNPAGGRVFGGFVRMSWDGGEQTIPIRGSSSEPGGKVLIEPTRVLTVEAVGLPGETLPSDRVSGIHTSHPDEAPGNTLLHHSFSVTFVKVRAPGTAGADSMIYGISPSAVGRRLLLLQRGTPFTASDVGADGAFRFTDLPAGEYVVTVAGTRYRSRPIRVDGQSQLQLDLPLGFGESELVGQVHGGAGRTLFLSRVDEDQKPEDIASQVIAEDGAYRFSGLAAGRYRVRMADAPALSPPVSLDGLDTATIDLVAPAPDKPLAHYVLFGPPQQAASLANLILAQDFLLAFRPAFGFNPQEATAAGSVTIIGDCDAVGTDIERRLEAEGILYQRIYGTAEEVASALAARVADGQAIPAPAPK